MDRMQPGGEETLPDRPLGSKLDAPEDVSAGGLA
jgi:hypothetical protein